MPASPRRRSRCLAAFVVAGAVAALSGCGDRFGPGSEAPADPERGNSAVAAAPSQAPAVAATTPAPSTPAAEPTPTTPELGEPRNVGGVIWQPRALYDGPVQISVRDGFVAAVVPSGSVGELRIADDGEVPVAALGASPVPAWARPHVGTDVTGRTVVTYPRCEDPDAVGTCDIYQWTAATKREVVLRGVSGAALAETEAVMDFGNVLVVREKRPVLTADELRFETPPLTTLLLKPRGQPLRVVTRHGGRQIDLRGSRIADIYTVPKSSSSICADQAARALNLDGLTIASRVVRCEDEAGGGGFAAPTGPSVADNRLRFAITSVGELGSALDHDLSTGKTRAAKLTVPVEWWTSDGQRSGYALDTVLGQGSCTPVKDAEPSDARCRISRSAKLSWKAIASDWTVNAGDPPVRD
ncbi:MAG: hypothetical protein JHD16_02315 [Solirubrobacteraceae bacterium]|nr:hypothetical protein [Solirubrobacteraceae bacterium]